MQVIQTAARINDALQIACQRHCHRIDGKVTARKIGIQRLAAKGCNVDHKTFATNLDNRAPDSTIRVKWIVSTVEVISDASRNRAAIASGGKIKVVIRPTQ